MRVLCRVQTSPDESGRDELPEFRGGTTSLQMTGDARGCEIMRRDSRVVWSGAEGAQMGGSGRNGVERGSQAILAGRHSRYFEAFVHDGCCREGA